MIDMHVEYAGKPLDYDMARFLALDRARCEALRQPEVIAWHRRATDESSPAFVGADSNTWWAKYGRGNGGRMHVSVGDDYEFILAESGGFDTLPRREVRNLRADDGTEYICLAGMLDDSGTPRKDACRPLDDWLADQY
jgi:hypothetical protein